MFEVGDWIKINDSKDGIVYGQFARYADDKRYSFYLKGSERKRFVKDSKLWEPKVGQWCWSYDFGFVQYLGKDDDDQYHNIRLHWSSIVSILHNLSNLEPFIGTLPTFIKDTNEMDIQG